MRQSPTKGQAALEFLTTYGWAFLIIIVMIGAIAYFGILNPSDLLPERCQVSPEFACQDYMMDGTAETLQFQLKQGIGKTIYLNSSNCSFEGVTPNIVVPATASMGGVAMSSGDAWSPRNAVDFSCDFSAYAASVSMQKYRGKKFKLRYELIYQTTSGGLSHKAEGEVFAEVQ